jgi:hypothetical protein
MPDDASLSCFVSIRRMRAALFSVVVVYPQDQDRTDIQQWLFVLM